MGAPENRNQQLDSDFLVAENNPAVAQQKAEEMKKQGEIVLMISNQKVLLQMKNLK